MLQTRVIPCLQLIGNSLVKTVKFKKPNYIGDPINTVRIFNELEVDELCFLDIRATLEKRAPDFEILRQIADECFMPLAYGGGVKDAATAQRILSIGFEKIIINSKIYESPNIISEIAAHSGVQSVVASVDVKKNIWGKYQVWSYDGTKNEGKDLIAWVQELEQLGAGEILLTAMDKDGTWDGFDIDMIRSVTDSVSIPVIANGGAGSLSHIGDAVKSGKASAVALGSMVVYQQKGMGVLVNFPDKDSLERVL